MNPQELLYEAAKIIDQRGQGYGGIENNFQLAADLAASKGDLSDVGEWLDSVDDWDDLIDTLTTEINKGAAK